MTPVIVSNASIMLMTTKVTMANRNASFKNAVSLDVLITP
jgi:hypothetical protein